MRDLKSKCGDLKRFLNPEQSEGVLNAPPGARTTFK